jgi:uncharacterized protein YdeI (YjbR/CyaY-like superfamily)
MEEKKNEGNAAPEKTDPRVDRFINDAGKWHDEFTRLRSIILDCGLIEELKWGVPCYTYQNKNIVLIHGFKNYCAILFIKGALLRDTGGILIRQTENVRDARQVRFTGVGEIDEMENILKEYIYEAIEIEKNGSKTEHRDDAAPMIPEEFKKRLAGSQALKTAFDALTPGRQRAYGIYFSGPKQSRTREARIERYIGHILGGKGLNDR